MIRAAAIAGFEKILDRYINQDPDAAHYLKPLAGKVIAISIPPLQKPLFFCPHENGIQLLEEFVGAPDTTITGTPVKLASLWLSKSPVPKLFSGDIEITGDVDTARRFQSLFDKIEFNLEEHLAPFTGDMLAHQVGRMLGASNTWAGNTLKTFKLNLVEFLQEETRDIPAKPEADILFADVDTLRFDSDRLQARIARLRSVTRETGDN